jgi:hypothetical protein
VFDAMKPFREDIRTATIASRLPWMTTAFLLFAWAVFGIAGWATGPVRWIMAGAGLLAMLGALAITVYALLRQPDLLKVERYKSISRPAANGGALPPEIGEAFPELKKQPGKAI